jgi:superfamily I DNA/RNA helicase
MTRARRHLYLSHAAERTQHGTARRTSRSPFLANLDPAMYEQIGDVVPRRQPRDTQLRLL